MKRVAAAIPRSGSGTRPGLGYVLAVLTSMVSAVGLIAAKPVLGYLDPLSFSVVQFGLAAALSGLWLAGQGKLTDLARLSRRQWSFLVVIALLFLAAIYTLWIALAMIPATTASLLNRLEVLVTVLVGMALLGDRFTRGEGLGAVIMFLGVVVIRYQAPPSLTAGFWMMVLCSTLFGVTEVLVKAGVHSIPPDLFAFARNAMVFVLFVMAALWRMTMREGGESLGFVDWEGIRRGFPLIATTALVGPFLARTLYLHCLRHIEVSRAALINQSQPIFVALYSAMLLHVLPTRREWLGGLLILIGAPLLVQWGRGWSGWRRRRRAEDAGHSPG